jgi:hypothetical protein
MVEIGRDSGELTAPQERAILALLSESSIRDAAKKAKVSETSLFRWLKEEVFSKAYFEARRLATSQTIAQIQQAGSEAVKTLRDVMKDKKATSGARVAAAKTVLEMSVKSVELEDLAQRVADLEKLSEGKR